MLLLSFLPMNEQDSALILSLKSMNSGISLLQIHERNLDPLPL
jgi:hypothetical protein